MAKKAKAWEWEDLPEECWELIFDRLKITQDNEIQCLSLVCKRFLSLSNRLRSTLNISDRTVLLAPKHDISPLFHRFHNVKRIRFYYFRGDIDLIIRQISRSDLRLEALDLSNQVRFPFHSIGELGSKMRATMKNLICANVQNLRYIDPITIAHSFPALEELDISYPLSTVTDSGIAVLASTLWRLRSINLSGKNSISDYSLMVLAWNCSLLSKISAQNCSFLTQRGVDFVIRRCSNLRSLSIRGKMTHSPPPPPADTIRSFPFRAKILQYLDLSHMCVSNDLLFAIREAKLHLNNLVLVHCDGFTFEGLSALLCKCRSLQHLCLVI